MKNNGRIVFLRKEYGYVNGFKEDRPHPWTMDLGSLGFIYLSLPANGLAVKDFMKSVTVHTEGENPISPGLNSELKALIGILSKSEKFLELMYQHVKPSLLALFHAWPEGKVGYIEVSDEEMSFLAYSLKKTTCGGFKKDPCESRQFLVTLQFSQDKKPLFFLSPFLERND